MRRIGTLTDATLAQKFCDYLVTLSIDAKSEQDGDQWDIWIRDEHDVDKARQVFSEFQQAPEDSRYNVTEEVARIRDQRIAEELKRRKQHREFARSVPRPSGGGAGPLLNAPVKQQKIPITIAIILVSVSASFASNFGKLTNRKLTDFDVQVFLGMSFVDIRDWAASDDDPQADREDPFASVRQGEWWRFVTPMFLHGDEFHLAFNMLWMFFLGSVIERLHGSLFLLALTLGTHIAGMMLQVSLPPADALPALLEPLAGSPFAIGASGAVYGLFGFLWIRPLVDHDYPIHLVPMNVVLMLGWLVACMTPLIPNVANGAHLGGLFAGMFAAMIGPMLKRK